MPFRKRLAAQVAGLLTLFLAVFTLQAGSAAIAQGPASLLANPPAGAWPSDGRDYTAQRYSPLTQINAQNAYLGAQEAKAAGSAAAFDAWLGNAPQAIPVSRASEGLGTVPRP